MEHGREDVVEEEVDGVLIGEPVHGAREDDLQRIALCPVVRKEKRAFESEMRSSCGARV